tara:strand:- start:87 stop:1172 length:1086 start_codon:yes stop_codon:yes gene_type:complete
MIATLLLNTILSVSTLNAETSYSPANISAPEDCNEGLRIMKTDLEWNFEKSAYHNYKRFLSSERYINRVQNSGFGVTVPFEGVEITLGLESSDSNIGFWSQVDKMDTTSQTAYLESIKTSFLPKGAIDAWRDCMNDNHGLYSTTTQNSDIVSVNIKYDQRINEQYADVENFSFYNATLLTELPARLKDGDVFDFEINDSKKAVSIVINTAAGSITASIPPAVEKPIVPPLGIESILSVRGKKQHGNAEMYTNTLTIVFNREIESCTVKQIIKRGTGNTPQKIYDTSASFRDGVELKYSNSKTVATCILYLVSDKAIELDPGAAVFLNTHLYGIVTQYPGVNKDGTPKVLTSRPFFITEKAK